jgi:hypothetical protein
VAVSGRADTPAPRSLLRVAFGDPELDRVLRELHERVAALAAEPRPHVVTDVELADGVETPIAHGLGRAPTWACPSAPRGASTSGRIEEVRSDEYDRDDVVVLVATGWGATITVDLAVL